MPKERNPELEKEQAILREMPPVKFKELQDITNTWMMQADPHALKVMAATVIANRLPGDPIWIFLIGPSSGGKTMMLSMLNKLEEIYPLSNLTPNTFVSGQRNVPGLLFEINGKILTFKDFTTILQLYQEARNEIMSQLREIYDGSYRKLYGTGEERAWTGKIGFIAGVTSVIDVTSQLYSALGERFIQYRLITPDRSEVALYAVNSSSRKKVTQDEAKKQVQEYFARYIKGVKESIDPDEEMTTSDEQRRQLVRITDFATLARSPVMRDSGPAREVYFKPTSEMPARFTQQLHHIMMAMMFMNRYEKSIAGVKPKETDSDITEDDELAIYKIALDSIPMMRRIVLQKVTEYDSATTAVIAALTNYPTNTTRRNLEDLNVLGIIDRIKDEANKADRWKIKDKYRKIMEEYDHVVPVPDSERELKEKEIMDIVALFEKENPDVQFEQG